MGSYTETHYCTLCTVAPVDEPNTTCNTCTEPKRTSEVDALLEKTGLTRDEIETSTGPVSDWVDDLQAQQKSTDAAEEATATTEREFVAAKKVEAQANTAEAAQSAVTDLVPEFGNILAKHESTAIAYGFPPVVDALIEKAKLDPVQTQGLLVHFRELFAQIGRWKADVETIEIAGVDDKESIAKAKEIAKAIQKERINAAKKKTVIKEPYLKPGQLIDGVFKVYIDEMDPIEKLAISKAQYVENLEKERKEVIKRDRIEKLTPFVDNVSAFNLHPDVMSDEAFDMTLSNSQAAHAARQREIEAEAAKVRREKQKRDRGFQLMEIGFSRDSEALRYIIGDITIYDADLENEPETVWETRIAEITPKAQTIRAEQKRLADEAEAIRKAEADREAAKQNEDLAKQREAEAFALAPDKVKLEKLAADIEAIAFPDVTNDKTISILGDTKSDLYQVVTRLRSKLNQLP